MTTTITAPELQLNTTDFHFVTAAQAGTEHSLRPVGDRPVLGAVTVVESAGRRLAVCTDTHRLHAVPVPSRTLQGVYTSHGGSYRLDSNATDNAWLLTVADRLTELQQPPKPHPVEARIARHHREPLLEILDRHPTSLVAFRSQSITVHDYETDELLDRIDRARALIDRMRNNSVMCVRASVLRRAVTERILVYTGAGGVSPLIGHRRERFAVLMPARPPIAVSTMWDSAGLPTES